MSAISATLGRLKLVFELALVLHHFRVGKLNGLELLLEGLHLFLGVFLAGL